MFEHGFKIIKIEKRILVMVCRKRKVSEQHEDKYVVEIQEVIKLPEKCRE